MNILTRSSLIFFFMVSKSFAGTTYDPRAGAGAGAGASTELVSTKARPSIDSDYSVLTLSSESGGIHLPHPHHYPVMTPSHMFGGVGPIPAAAKQPGMKDPQVNFFEGVEGQDRTRAAYKRYAEAFFNTPVTQYKPDFQKDIRLLRGEVTRRPTMYLSTYKNIKAYLMQARSTSGDVSLERRDERLFFDEEALSADEEARLMTELQGPRMPLGDGLTYGGLIIGGEMANAIEAQRERIFQSREQIARLKSRLKSLGGKGHTLFASNRNYAVFTLCIISGSRVYSIPLPALFSSALSPTGVSGVTFNYDSARNLAGLSVPELEGNTLYYLDSIFGGLVNLMKFSSENRKRVTTESQNFAKKYKGKKKELKALRKALKSLKKNQSPDLEAKEKEVRDLEVLVANFEKHSRTLAKQFKTIQKIYDETQIDLLEKTIDKTASLYKSSHGDFPHSTRDSFKLEVRTTGDDEAKVFHEQTDFIEGTLSAPSEEAIERLKRNLSDAYTHSEQAALQYLMRTKWMEGAIRKFVQENPHVRIDGIIGLYGTLRDACSNCAKAITINGYHDVYIASSGGKRKIPYTTVISGFKPYEQHALVHGAGGAEAYTTEKTSRDPLIGVTYPVRMDLKGRKVAIYAGPPYE